MKRGNQLTKFIECVRGTIDISTVSDNYASQIDERMTLESK